MATRRLSDLQEGERGVIERIMGKGPFRHRLMEMGFVPGAEIIVERHAPLKDPIEYIIKGYHVSLRHQEADNVLVQVQEG